jgi:glycosyltransferase involved in cell wall biosynthesis/protein-tyrosine-phosphatase
MRVCHVMSADLWAGAEVQVATTLGYLVERSDVEVIAVLLNEGRLAEELRQLGAEVAVVDEHRHSSLALLRFLLRFLRNRQVDIVHTHRYKDTVLGAIAAKLVGVPHVIRTVHGLREPMRGWDRAKFSGYEALDKAALWCFADRVIAVSSSMADTLRQSGYRRASVMHIHNGLDLEKVKAMRSRQDVRRELGVSSRAFLIGTVGRLSAVKGHSDLLRAARLILQRERGARFLIVGGGPLRDELIALAAELGVDHACLFTGPRSDVCDLVGAMDLFVLPSLDEGIPMALLEAMALGRPVVASHVGGVPEVIRPGETGLLVPPRDVRALASACLDLAANREWADMLGTRARRLVEAEFSQASNGRDLLTAYRDVASGQPGCRGNVSVASLCTALPAVLLQRAWRKLRCACERLRAVRIRRNPEALTAALRSAKSILIVCHGNIIRSPFAARLVARALGAGAQVTVASGGLEAVSGRPPHATAVATATALGVDLADHVAAPVTPERVAASDVIFVMDVLQLLSMRQRFPDARAKTFLLTCLAPEASMEIIDPVDGDESVVRACYDHISKAVGPIVNVLTAAPQQS